MPKEIIITLLPFVALVGCYTITTEHEIVPISMTESSRANDHASGKTDKDLLSLCSAIDPAFMRLPVNEQNQIAKIVFSRTQNLHHIQYIRSTWLRGKPCEIEMLLYDEGGWNVLRFNFQKNRKGEWILLTIGHINVCP